MTLIKKYEDIIAWQEARNLVASIHKLTNSVALAKDSSMRDQLQRASISAMTNVAEGFDCESKAEFARLLGVARRSTIEVQSLLYAALDVGYIDEETFDAEYKQAEKTKALIAGLKRAVKPRDVA